MKINFIRFRKDIPRQENHHLACYITNVYLTLTCAISLAVSIPTNLTSHQVQPNGPQQTGTCGNVCEYEEWFQRAQCNERKLIHVPISAGCEGAILLELQENNIQRIPPERIAEYNHVRTLDISWNQISVIDPGTFWGLDSLKNIRCSHNRLERLSDGVLNGTEKSLTRIFMDNNKIRILGNRAFEGLSQVTEIYLNNNCIKVLPLTVFSDVINIKHLTLAHNGLKYLYQDQFNGLKKLITLSLEGNNIQTLPEGLFDGLQSLQEVSLSNNVLITIPAPQNLGLNLSVKRLDFSNNHLNQSAIIFTFLVNANWTLYFNGNHFLCDCDFQKLQEWFNTTSTPQTMHISSEAPLACEFNDVIQYSIMDYLPNLCSYATNESSNIDTLSNSSVTSTAQPVTKNGHRQLTSIDTTPGWLSIVIFIEITLFFTMWLAKTVYKRCKKKRQYFFKYKS